MAEEDIISGQLARRARGLMFTAAPKLASPNAVLAKATVA
jgi:hypothetical protein